MPIRRPIRLGLQAAAALAVVSAAIPASAQTPTIVILPTAPLPPRVETIPPPPSDELQMMTWEQGHWTWNGSTWNWVNGHYAQRPAPAATWDPGHWSPQASGGYIWVEGRLRN